MKLLVFGFLLLNVEKRCDSSGPAYPRNSRVSDAVPGKHIKPKLRKKLLVVVFTPKSGEPKSFRLPAASGSRKLPEWDVLS